MKLILIYSTSPYLKPLTLVKEPSDAQMLIGIKQETTPNSPYWASAKWAEVQLDI